MHFTAEQYIDDHTITKMFESLMEPVSVNPADLSDNISVADADRKIVSALRELKTAMDQRTHSFELSESRRVAENALAEKRRQAARNATVDKMSSLIAKTQNIMPESRVEYTTLASGSHALRVFENQNRGVSLFNIEYDPDTRELKTTVGNSVYHNTDEDSQPSGILAVRALLREKKSESKGGVAPVTGSYNCLAGC